MVEEKEAFVDLHCAEDVTLSDEETRQDLLETIRDRLDLTEEELTVHRTLPDHRKLLLRGPAEPAELLAYKTNQNRLLQDTVESAHVIPSAPDREEDLDFDRKDMVDWFSPTELIRAGSKAFLSHLFGSYADQREIQALEARSTSKLHARDNQNDNSSLPDKDRFTGEQISTHDELIEREVADYSDRSGVWVDYVADLGDGFNPTHTIAQLLAQPTFSVSASGDRVDTQRGDLLVMGGDQVYPTATREEYNDRLVGPYQAALPYVLEETPPRLFAVPGNHDWYDGLTSFNRLFCQNRWIGGWKTEQQRSYFAVNLPGDWWLWGIDVQLESDVDLPQFTYFQHLARLMEPGSNIILCTAEPSWVYAEQMGKQAYKNLQYFKDEIIEHNDHNLVVGLAGDLHTYAHYREHSDSTDQQNESLTRHRFIAGGGGAYLYPSHQLPERLKLPPDATSGSGSGETDTTVYEQHCVFPDKSTSRWEAWKVLQFPIHNWKFSCLLAAFYLLIGWLMQSSSVLPFDQTTGKTYLEQLANLPLSLTGLGDLLLTTWEVFRYSPLTAAVIGLAVYGLYRFTDKEHWVDKLVYGLMHTGLHITLALLLLCVFAELNLHRIKLDIDHPSNAALFAIEMAIAGGLLGGMLFGGFMLLLNETHSWIHRLDLQQTRLFDQQETYQGVHANELLSCQSNPDYKHVLRLKVREDDTLIIYPIGVETVYKKWEFQPGASAGNPWFEPASGTIEDCASLIEEPIVISPGNDDGNAE